MLPSKPTDHLPGTEGKIQAMVARAARGEDLFHPKDGDMDQFDMVRAVSNPDLPRMQIVWRVLSEREYRAEGHEEPYWEACDYLPEVERCYMDHQADGYRILQAMRRGRWMTFQMIRAATNIQTPLQIDFWIRRWGDLVTRRKLKKIRRLEYRIDTSNVDEAREIVQNYGQDENARPKANGS